MPVLPNPTDPAEFARSALGGIKEAIKVGREIKDTAHEVNSFLDEEAKARIAWKKRQQQMLRRGDMVWMEAVNEYRIIRQIRDAEMQMYKDVEKEFGRSAVAEIKNLIQKLRKDHRELNDEYHKARMQTRREMKWLILIALLIYSVFKMTGVW